MLSELLDADLALRRHRTRLATVQKKAGTVADGARCSIGTQQQTLVNSLLEHYDAELRRARRRQRAGRRPGARGRTRRDRRRRARDSTSGTLSKLPDWTYEESWDGETPVERFTDHRAANTLDT